MDNLLESNSLSIGPDGSGSNGTVSSEVSDERMTSFQAYFALLKAYCAINILLLPKAFKNGGYLLSPLALILACLFECTCAIKLS
jgi:amino acid permease